MADSNFLRSLARLSKSVPYLRGNNLAGKMVRLVAGLNNVPTV